MGDPVVGKAVYMNTGCNSCHGDTGAGDGPAAVALEPKPADLSKTPLSDERVKEIIKKGSAAVGRSPNMPPFGGVLSDVDIDQVLAYIKSLKK